MDVLGSDYMDPGTSVVTRMALVEFSLLEPAENCSLLKECNFEGGSCNWELGEGVAIVQEEDITSANIPSDGSGQWIQSQQEPAMHLAMLFHSLPLIFKYEDMISQ